MSGGVDSSVSAYLLKKQGYDVTGVFIKVWQPDTTDCGWKDERRDAMRVAAILDIPFITLDFSDTYKKEVVDYMIDEYRQGRTPNPDIMCNRHVKFGSFLNYAKSNGADYVATGHYAQNEFNTETGLYELKEGKDKNKDQSYFLWTLTQEDLKHVLFPVGHLHKPEVRELAEKAKLPIFDKKDSQGVCFIGHLDMKSFLKEYIHTKKGDVLNTHGAVIGSHDGSELYTIGERHGFELQHTSNSHEPHFVVKKDIIQNTITVASKTEYSTYETLSSLAPSHVRLTKTSFSQGISHYVNKKISCRIRYRQEKQDCKLIHEGKDAGYVVLFDIPQKGMAEGQSVVLYDGDTCLGGGILQIL
jgi:tRNA-specific 2-thiouridylase